jgi:hypothetical protein
LIEAKKMDKRALGFKRRNLAQTKASEIILELLKEAKKAGVHAQPMRFLVQGSVRHRRYQM